MSQRSSQTFFVFILVMVLVVFMYAMLNENYQTLGDTDLGTAGNNTRDATETITYSVMDGAVNPMIYGLGAFALFSVVLVLRGR